MVEAVESGIIAIQAAIRADPDVIGAIFKNGKDAVMTQAVRIGGIVLIRRNRLRGRIIAKQAGIACPRFSPPERAISLHDALRKCLFRERRHGGVFSRFFVEAKQAIRADQQVALRRFEYHGSLSGFAIRHQNRVGAKLRRTGIAAIDAADFAAEPDVAFAVACNRPEIGVAQAIRVGRIVLIRNKDAGRQVKAMHRA